MFFTHEKSDTLRIAEAMALITMSPETMKRVREKSVPKGDVLELARCAGVMAAKKTPDLLPYCHPMPLDGVQVTFDCLDNAIKISAKVIAIWKTGVEMEALTAVSVAALTIYDMLKPLDKDMEIGNIRLQKKKGGKSDYQEKIQSNFKSAVMVTSDGTHQGTREDKSGKIIKECLESLGLKQISYFVLPDEKLLIAEKLNQLCQEHYNLIVTTGGTGLGPRDVTVEATLSVIDREVPGAAEKMRSYGQSRTPYAMLSRGIVGQKGQCIIVNLPGSSNGAKEGMAALFPALLHAYPMMEGGGH